MPRRFRRETISASGTITHTFSLSSNSLHFEQCLPVDHPCNIWQWESMLKIPTFCEAAFLMEDPTEVWLPSPRNSYLLQEQNRTIIVPWPLWSGPSTTWPKWKLLSQAQVLQVGRIASPLIYREPTEKARSDLICVDNQILSPLLGFELISCMVIIVSSEILWSLSLTAVEHTGRGDG